MMVIGFPFCSFVWIRRNYQNLHIRDLTIKYGTLFTDLKTHKLSTYKSILFFYARRLLLVLTTVYLNKYIVVSMYAYFYSSIFLIQFYIRSRPFEKMWAHWLEIFNEGFVIIATYFVFCFTEFIQNV